VASVEPLPGGGFLVGLTAGRTPATTEASGAAGAEVVRDHDTDDDRAGVDGRSDDGVSDAIAAASPWRPDESFEADAVILAVPPGQAARLGATAGTAGASRWDELGYSPIVNVHVVYDRQVTDLPFAAAVDSPVQWVFDKTRVAGLASGQYLAVSLSAADEYVDVPAARLRADFLPALARLFPAAAGAEISDFFVTRERRATFRQAPGCGALRPGAATSVPGLVLAGSWTDTGWPDTMEGAVRSGHNAAQELIRALAGLPPADRNADLDPAGTGAL
jgi:monoamine oxidase